MSVYFMQVGKDMIKIGASVNPEQRISGIVQQFYEPVVLLAIMPGYFKEEAEVHAKFADDLVWLQGELFQKSPRLMRFIKPYRCKPVHGKPPKGAKSKINKKIPWDEKAAAEWLAAQKNR